MMIKRYGFKVSAKKFERTYRVGSNLDDIHENGIHDYLKYIKFGYGRCTDHASKDIRAGLINREKGLNLIREMDIDPSVSGMRSFREHVKTSKDPILYSLTTEFDFYTMSNFRDLVFHTEEHRFTGPELSDVLESSNLHFLDFEYHQERIKKLV